jgi:hypothetical protein
MGRKLTPVSIVAGTLTGLLALPGSNACASELVPQTWLRGEEIVKKYGQYVDEVPRPSRVDGSNALVITQSEFQQRMLPSTLSYPAPFTGTYIWGFGAEERGPYSYRAAAPAYPGPTVVVQSYPRGDPRSLTHDRRSYVRHQRSADLS